MKSYAQRRSKLQEKRAARDVGGRAQKGSGSSQFAKGDFRSVGNVRGECKHTVKSTYILKHDELKKIQKEALMGSFEDWVMQVEFVGAVGQSKKFAVLDWQMFMDMWAAYPNSSLERVATSSICQIGKSFQLKLSATVSETGYHFMQLAFATGDEPEQPKAKYIIVPWQAYLDVRGAYLESREAQG